ncbi:retrovirus-related pol polyprotein from transposon TNT 1-94, partial [Tanacetum coccineum]
ISQDIVNIVVNSSEIMNASVNVNSSTAMNDSVNYVEMCNKCLELEAELIKHHNMSQTGQVQFFSSPQSQTGQVQVQLYAKLQVKDTTIKKLKAQIKGVPKTSTSASVKMDIDEIETINIELEHRVKLKGKDTVDNAAQVSNATSIAPGMYRDKNNRETHIYYLKHTMEQAAILREIVQQTKSLNPLDSSSYTAYKSEVKFLASNDEAPDFIIKFLKMIQVRLNATVRNIHIDNGTEFVNQTLHSYYESVSISHETSVARTPQQNGVVERRNRTLVEAARTMLIYAKAPLFLWAEGVATACYTQN